MKKIIFTFLISICFLNITFCLAGSKILTGVPRYDWWYGCAPTSFGMVVGYWDSKGYNLVDGDISGTNSPTARNIIASPEHISDYWVAYNSMIPDPSPGGHAANSIADFIHTSYTTADGMADGATSSFFLESGMDAFNAWDNPLTVADETFNTIVTQLLWAGIDFDFNVFKSQIDQGAPVVLAGDVDGTGTAGGGHMVVGYGYDDPDGIADNGDEMIAVMDTWGAPGVGVTESGYAVMNGGHEWWPYQTTSVNEWYIQAAITYADPAWLGSGTVPETDTLVMFMLFTITFLFASPFSKKYVG